ncbi:MAG TPA: cyclic nucleotide-binding domain-containing protein, partial [Aggregatilineales bacterium]|nr:cyclic nucleotide-binding domain-containing protein [Aggregatilineales bacterium]
VRDEQTQATAIEALDTLGDRQLVKQLIPLVETWQAPGAAQTLSPEGVISLLIAEEDLPTHDDGWLRALAIRSSGELDLQTLVPELRAIAADSDMLIGGAARDALAHLGEVGETGEAVKTLQTISLMERILFMREVPLFAELSPDDLKQIADVAHENLYASGSILCREGDEGHEMFIIASGSVRILKTVDGAQKLLAVRGAGEIVGEMAIIDAIPRSATAQANGETRTLVIDGNTFKTILRDRPEVTFAVLQVLSRRLRERT